MEGEGGREREGEGWKEREREGGREGHLSMCMYCTAVVLRLASTVYTWSEGDGEVTVVIEKIGVNERIVSTSLQVNPITARRMYTYCTIILYGEEFAIHF